MPHMAMPGSSFFCFKDKVNYNLISGNDVCVVQRCCTPPQFEFLKIAVALNMKIIYDLDDDVFDIPESNPAFGTLMSLRDGFITCMRMVDVITVSTQHLARVVKKNVKDLTSIRTGKQIPVIVIENRIEPRLFTKAVPPKQPLTIGWAGSSSHIGDLPLIEKPLVDIATAYPGVEIEFRGCPPTVDSGLAKMKNFKHKYWMPVPEFGTRMPTWGWSIALAPITNHPFNSSKSCIKMIEAAWCGIPCLASWERPYEEFCSHDPELKYLLCAGESVFRRKLFELVVDKEFRDDLGRRMRAVVNRHYKLLPNTPHEGWLQALQAAMDGPHVSELAIEPYKVNVPDRKPN